MPRVVGKATRVVETDSLQLDELVGVGSKAPLSVAQIHVSAAFSEPFKTAQYDEWLCVKNGSLEIECEGSTTTVSTGETVHIVKGERFRVFFSCGGVDYLAICLPAFQPGLCAMEDGTTPVTEGESEDIIYHMCQVSLWNESLEKGIAYYPPTFEADGYFTHATKQPSLLLSTANHFYTQTKGDWICLKMSVQALKDCGIITKFEAAMAVGSTAAKEGATLFPHVYGGIPYSVVRQIYPMTRDPDSGAFLVIQGLVGE